MPLLPEQHSNIFMASVAKVSGCSAAGEMERQDKALSKNGLSQNGYGERDSQFVQSAVLIQTWWVLIRHCVALPTNELNQTSCLNQTSPAARRGFSAQPIKFERILIRFCRHSKHFVEKHKKVQKTDFFELWVRSWFRAFTLDPNPFQLNPNSFQMNPIPST